MTRDQNLKCSTSRIEETSFKNRSAESHDKFGDKLSDTNIVAERGADHCAARTFHTTYALLCAGLLAFMVLAAPGAARASIGIGISVGIAPPPIPIYSQPVCPAPGYMWTPGYWAYDPADGYYWVPGTWVMAPEAGLLWTPGYWGWEGSAFFWHGGYWGPHVGFYGGINYGFGYGGVGFVGGEWRGRDFYYNRSVNNFGGGHFDHFYDHPVASNFAMNRVSYNGGAGGLSARPGPGELAAEHDRHIEATSMQHEHEMAAHGNRGQFASENHGKPQVAATGRPGEFRGGGAVAASRAGGPVNAAQFHAGNTARGGEPNGNHSGYAGNHTPNPGGGGNHEVMTAHQNAPPAIAHNESPRGSSFHAQPQEHSYHASGEGAAPHNAPHAAPEPHGGAAPHEGGAPHGGESREPHK